jgi:uncharacterized protein YyaL (SSP411 family)
MRTIGTIFVCLLVFSCTEKRECRLARASSPYLRAQAADPVDWYEWGDEALARARKENKPLLVSVGYASCHWCHVMERETFADTGVARLMNRNFVCIKVDREERPDIDKMYSAACQLISGNSGWPLNAFALPDGKPFFAGTYYSRQGWINLLGQIETAYRSQLNKIELQAQGLASAIGESGLGQGAGGDSARGVAAVGGGGSSGAGDDSARGVAAVGDLGSLSAGRTTWKRHFEEVYRKMDPVNGGMQGAPKFPMPAAMEFLLQYYVASGDKRALDAATNSLTRMALGGIYDQLGGGFARYAVDTAWHIPHFEKLLGDNAELLTVYAHAYQLTHDDLYKKVVLGIAGFVERDLGCGDGGYYSALNADTRAGEGEFYAWSAGELQSRLGAGYAPIADYYGVSEEGNWKADRNILIVRQRPERFAESRKIDTGLFATRLEAARVQLLLARDKREKPSVDKSIVTRSNAELLRAYLDGYAATGEPRLFQLAMKTALFLEKDRVQADGRLLHIRGDGGAVTVGFLDDYAFLASAYVRLYELSFEKHWLQLAKRLADRVNERLFDKGKGMFLYSDRDRDKAIIPTIEIGEDSRPSSNAVMAEVLYKVGNYFEREDYVNRARQIVSSANAVATPGEAIYYAKWCSLEALLARGINEVAIVGPGAIATSRELQRGYLPFCLFLGSTGKEDLPLLEGKGGSPQTWIYVCTNKVCKRPVAAAAEAMRQLDGVNFLSISGKSPGRSVPTGR